MGGCSSRDCNLAPKCRDCKHNFVEKEGDICEVCKKTNKLKCDHCFRAAKVLYDLRPTKNSVLPAHVLHICSECNSTVCRNCGSYSYSLSAIKICATCRAKNGWIPEKGISTCKECKAEDVVNADMLCESCFTEMYSKYQTTCPKCYSKFEPKHETQYLCQTCLPKCACCGQKFYPADRTQIICTACVYKVDTVDICKGCGDLAIITNSGRCKNCTDRSTGSNLCEICYTNVTNSRICNTCINKKLDCPVCNVETTATKNYKCLECKKEQEMKFR